MTGPRRARDRPPSHRATAGWSDPPRAGRNQPGSFVPAAQPIGVCFSGGIDSGAVFLVTYHMMRKLGLSPSRLKAFTLTFGEGDESTPQLWSDRTKGAVSRYDIGLMADAVERVLSAFTDVDRALDALGRNASPKIVADWLALQI